MSQSCANCSKTKGLKKCTGCMGILYCSRECSVADWKIHKLSCKFSQNKLKLKKETFFDNANEIRLEKIRNTRYWKKQIQDLMKTIKEEDVEESKRHKDDLDNQKKKIEKKFEEKRRKSYEKRRFERLESETIKKKYENMCMRYEKMKIKNINQKKTIKIEVKRKNEILRDSDEKSKEIFALNKKIAELMNEVKMLNFKMEENENEKSSDED